MSLEKIVEAARYADEQVHRIYAGLTKRWEDKGRSRYSLGLLLNCPTWIAMLGSGGALKPLGEVVQAAYIPVSFAIGWARGYDFAQQLFGLTKGSDITGISEYGTRKVVTIPYFYHMERFCKGIRLPLLAMGGTFLTLGAINLYRYITEMDPGTLSASLKDFQLGVSQLGVASAIYVRQSDPKVLDKAPFWQTAYNWAKERTASLMPAPEPVPVPIPVNPRC